MREPGRPARRGSGAGRHRSHRPDRPEERLRPTPDHSPVTIVEFASMAVLRLLMFRA
ncbi:hypothetical protein ABZW18_30600 [Streptomyces sp. NPDC004647]|uniref:hypothetical protein n=1 Tax=Streptomyces sp. NPDC004647 TaxID=3154671 RepID=UPI00339DC0A4